MKKCSNKAALSGSSPLASSAIDRLAKFVGMPVDHVRGAIENIRRERMKNRLMEKVRLIREGRSAILPSGEIVEQGTPGAMQYTGHVPCRKCGQTHWVHGACPPSQND